MPSLCIIPARALQDPEMTGVRLTALCAIGKFTSRDGRGVWAANDTIAEAANIDERHFRRAAAWLVEHGYVRKQRRYKTDGSQDTNMLAIVLDDPEDVTAGAEGGRAESAHLPRAETAHPRRAESAHPPRAESTPPGRADSAHQTSPLNATASPPPAGEALPPTPPATPREPVVAPLEAVFEHAAHREAYLAQRRSHRLPASFDAGLRDVHEPINGGPAFAWPVIGAALLQLQANGETFNVNRLRGYCRSQLAGAPTSGRASAPSPVLAVRVGSQPLPASAIWRLCVDVGLTSPMLSADTVSAAIARLHERGAIDDPVAFASLVQALDPATLAEIKFAKTREERLAERLAAWAAQAPERAA